MAVNSNLALLITASDKSAGPLRKTRKSIQTLTKDITKMQKSFKGFSAGQIAATVGITGLGAAVTATGFQFNMMTESAELAFQTLLKDGAKGTKFLGDLKTFARSTPFEFEELTEASRRLLGFGFAAEDVIPLLKDVGDAVGAMGGGADMVQRVTTALGQMQTKGKASAEELMQLAEAGIPVWQMLRDNVDELFGADAGAKFRAGMQSMVDRLTAQGMSPAEALAQAQTAGTQRLMKMVSGGKLSATKTIAAIRKGMAQSFGGLGAKQADTMSGSLSNLNDTFKQLMGTLTGGAFGQAKTAVQGLTKVIEGMLGPAEALMGKDSLLPEALKGVIGVAALLGGGALGGSIGGGGPLGALSGLLSGGGGGGQMMLLLVGLAVGIAALLLPLNAIMAAAAGVWDAIKSTLHVIVDNWPSGGGGGGAGFPGGPIPVVAEIVLKPGAKEQLQRDVDLWGALSGKIGLVPQPRETVQAQIDPWILTKQLSLSLPIVGDVQRIIDAWKRLTAGLDLTLPTRESVQTRLSQWAAFAHGLNLNLPVWSTLQGAIDTWANFQKALDLMPPAWAHVQGILDAWPALQKSLGLPLPAPTEVQGRIDAWTDFSHKLGLVLPGPETPQGEIDLWANLTKGLNLQIPDGGTMQTGIEAAYPSLVSGLNLSIIPKQSDIQHLLDAVFPNLKINVGVDVKPGLDPGKIPGLAPDVPKVPGGITTTPLPGLGASGGQIGPVKVPPLPKFASGGVVPGPLGSPLLAMVHGGETITPAGRGGGTTVTVVVQGNVWHDVQLEDAVVAALDRAGRRGRVG